MPKVLRIINRFNLGGPTYNAAYLTKYISSEYDTLLIGGSPAAGEAHSGFILDHLNVPYIEIPEMSRSINPLNDLKAFRKIRRIIRETKPDIVHTHAAKAGALGRLAARMEKVPVIVHTYHGHVFSNYFSAWKSWIARMIERNLARLSSAIVVISKKQREEIVDQYTICSDSKAHVIPLGFDLSKFGIDMEKKRRAFRDKYALDDTTVAIGIIGRFAPVKNHILFFESLKELSGRSKNWVAFVIGDGELNSSLQQKVKELELNVAGDSSGKVIFTSWIQQIDEAMAGLDIVALTSLNEGTPVSLIEAQASGKPIVTTNVGGVQDCMLENQSGYITRNSKESVSASLFELISDAGLRKKMGESGREFVLNKFNYTRLVSDMKALYDNLLESKKV